MNHNILNRIADNYIQNRIKEAKFRIYYYFRDRHDHGFIEADNDDDALFAIFKKSRYDKAFFLKKYRDKDIIKKQLAEWWETHDKRFDSFARYVDRYGLSFANDEIKTYILEYMHDVFQICDGKKVISFHNKPYIVRYKEQ